CSVGQGTVWTAVVVLIDEDVQEGLELVDGAGLGLSPQPVLQGLLEALYFSAGGGVVGLGVLLDDVPVVELLLEGIASALASDAGEADCVDHAVVGQGGGGDAVLTCGFAEGHLHDGGGDDPVRG